MTTIDDDMPGAAPNVRTSETGPLYDRISSSRWRRRSATVSRSTLLMTRLFLTWIGIAILQFGIPRSISAAELVRASGESSSVTQRLHAPSNQALELHQPRREAVQTAGVTPFAPAASPRLSRAPAVGASFLGTPSQPGPASDAHVLPDARAPPA